jgi:SAM-dependent methyltransferase
MSHEHLDPDVLLSAEYWDDRYGSTEQVWSGNPNQRLVEQVSDLTPGRALDVGCGEGADAIWLAERGWETTGVDVSAIALRRAGAHAEQRGVHVSWDRVDARTWSPPPAEFDLVSAHFVHMPWPDLQDLLGRLGAAVRQGGSLLIVGHDKSDLHTTIGRPDLPDFFFTADQVAAALDGDKWRIAYAKAPARDALDPDGKMITIRDAVCRAVRR